MAIKIAGRKSLLVWALLIVSSASQADTVYYKCVVDGRTAFQDAPCAAGASTKQVISGSRAGPGPDSASGDEGGTTLERERAALDRIQTERRMQEIDRLLDEKELGIKQLDRQTEQRLNDLQARINKAYEEPNGASSASSLAQEMRVVAASHGSRTRALRDEIAVLKEERAQLAQ